MGVSEYESRRGEELQATRPVNLVSLVICTDARGKVEAWVEGGLCTRAFQDGRRYCEAKSDV